MRAEDVLGVLGVLRGLRLTFAADGSAVQASEDHRPVS
jgi:hypothetical protein